MTKKKAPARQSRKSAGSGESEATLVQVPPGMSPAGADSFNIRMNGGVIEHEPAMGSAEKSLREMAGELVELPRLDFTVMDPLLGRILPTDQPVKVSYRLAYTLGLLNVNPNNPPSAIRQQSLVTEPQSEPGERAADNGHGGDGRESGYEQPAHDLAAQPVTLDEIEEAAKESGRDNESVEAMHEREVNARRAALRP